MITKRIYELRKGDVFRMLGRLFKVTRVDEFNIHYRYYDTTISNTHSDASSFGCFNQAKVEIISKPHRP